MLKSMLVDKDFQTWHLIGWQQIHQPIKSRVRNPCLVTQVLTWICLVIQAPAQDQLYVCTSNKTSASSRTWLTNGVSLLNKGRDLDTTWTD